MSNVNSSASTSTSTTSQNSNTIQEASKRTYDTFVKISVGDKCITDKEKHNNKTYEGYLGIDEMALIKQSSLSGDGGSNSLRFEPVLLNLPASAISNELRQANGANKDVSFEFIRVDKDGKPLLKLEIKKGKVQLVNDLTAKKGMLPRVDIFIDLIHFVNAVYADGSPHEFIYNYEDGGLLS